MKEEGKMEKQGKKGGCLKVALIVVGVIVVLGIIGSVLGGGDDTPQKADNTTSEEQQNTDTETQENESGGETKFGVGETAEMNDIQVTMLGYEESSGSEYNVPAEGNTFVLINFEIVNNSDEELSVSSMMSFEAYADDYAASYSLNALLEKEGAGQLDGTIAPGKKMNGVIGYEVPSGWSNMEIHFVDNVWSDNKFVFEITK